MAITTPEFYDLKSFVCDSTTSRDGIFPYAIGIRKKDGLWWSLGLSFLFPVKDFENFKVRLSKLCGCTDLPTETITEGEIADLYQFLEKYNPFRNRYSCRYNQTLRTTMRIFDENIRRIGNIRRVKNSTKGHEHCDIYLQAASCILKCDIALCDVLDRNVKIFRPQPSTAVSDNGQLTLYRRSEENNESNKFFCFAIAREVGIELQKIALRSILGAANIYPKNVNCILRSISPNSNIILTLVNQNMFAEICILFKQSHTLFKLEEAGYKVNPTIPDDDGNTALYCAIKSNKEKVVHLFYNYLSGAIQLSGVSPRNPEESVLTNLEDLQSVLSEHMSKFRDSGSERASVFLEELIKFSSFQAAMVTEFLELEDITPSLSYKLCEVEKKKRKIISILVTYEKFFSFEDTMVSVHDSAQTSDLEKLIACQESFKKYERYHQILDFNAALFFFDNLFALKQNLTLDNKVYETVESAFLRYILICNFYTASKFFPSNNATRTTRKTEQGDKFLQPKSRRCRVVYMERMKLKKMLEEFKDLLIKTQVTDESTKIDPESDIGTVTSLPNIRDVIIFRAVLHYLDVVSKIEINSLSQEGSIDAQAVLVIERTLQVVGEALNERYDGSISLGTSLLVSALPIGIRKKLRDIRDQLSHVDSENAECRKRIETCNEIFEGIKDELHAIRLQIERNHRPLELMATKYVLHAGCLHRKEIQTMLRQNNDLSSDNSKQGVTQLSKSIKDERRFSGVVQCAIRKEISSFSHHSNLQIHFNYINQYMFETQITSKTDRLTKILFHLNCIETLFSHFFKEVRKESNAAEELKEILDEIKDLAMRFFGKEALNEEQIQETQNEEQIQETLNEEHIQETLNEEHIQETLNEEQIQETLKEKGELVMKKYEEIYGKIPPSKSFKQIKIKTQSKTKIKHSTLMDKLQIVFRNGHNSVQKGDLSLSRGSQFRTEQDSHRDEEETPGEMNKEVREYPFIERLREALNYCYPITAEEMHSIIDHVPIKYKEHSKAKVELLEIFEEMPCAIAETEEKVRALIQKLLPSSKRKELEKDFGDENNLSSNTYTLKSIKDHFGDMINRIDNNDLMDGAEFKNFCSNLELPPEAKELLSKGVQGVTFKPKNDTVLNYLRDKIAILEKILIKSDRTIDRMWSQVKSSKTKQHIIYRVKERYVRDSKVQAAVEMLLFDCMNILKRRADLRRVWMKASNLFNGLNLRNFLAHGNPLFEEVGRMLDPDDLPSEIVSKCLELVDDRNVIEAMCELYRKTGGTREDFIAVVKSRDEDGLCNAIRSGEKWESYASLIPSRSTTGNTSSVGKAVGKRRRQKESS